MNITIHRLRRKLDDSCVFVTRRLRSARCFADDGRAARCRADDRKSANLARRVRRDVTSGRAASRRHGDTAAPPRTKSETDGTTRVRAGRSRVQYPTALFPAVTLVQRRCCCRKGDQLRRRREQTSKAPCAVGVLHVTATHATRLGASLSSALPCERPHRAASFWPCRSETRS